MRSYQLGKIVEQIGRKTEIDVKSFHRFLSSKPRLKAIRRIPIVALTMRSLLTGLVRTNGSKLALTVLLFVVQLGVTVASPFLTSFLIEEYLQSESGSVEALLLVFLGYKLVKSVVGIVCDFCYQSLGYEYFARLYWLVLQAHVRISGKMLNLVEYDCNMLSNLPYAALTALFDLAEILVILGLFVHYLSGASSFPLFAAIIVLYLASQALVSYFTFQFTRKYLLEKDKRLAYNLANDTGAAMVSQRAQELGYNRKFLYSKILSKFVTIVFPMLINLYVFVVADQEAISGVQYILLILINLIRNPINELLFTLNLIVEISNSCQRIINFRPDTEEAHSLSEGGINQTEDAAESLAVGSALNQQKGAINLRSIASYCFKREDIGVAVWVLLAVLVVLMLCGKFFNFLITKHIISHKSTALDFLGLGYQLFIPLALYYLLIVITQRISRSLFSDLQQRSLNCEFLNRISGDITAIDRSITINLNETLSSLAFVVASYTYSIYSLNNLVLQLALLFFLCLSLAASLKVNRFIMFSRREVARQECLLKAGIIRSLVGGSSIVRSRAMRRSWRNIFECKEMGLFIENYFMGVLNVVVLVFSLALVGVCKQVEMSSVDKSILLIACLNVDYDLLNMFLSAVRLEICLVSFERVLNVLRPR